jgi:hypothetical protein
MMHVWFKHNTKNGCQPLDLVGIAFGCGCKGWISVGVACVFSQKRYNGFYLVRSMPTPFDHTTTTALTG